jgi:AcrR family transcriptional regulator
VPRASVEETERTAWERRSVERLGGSALQRSRRIVDAARELVSEGGIEAVTLRPLLERSGLSRRAFYERFKSMDDVLLALFEETMARGAEGLARRIENVSGASARIEAVVRGMASAAQNPTMHRVYLLAMSNEHVRLAEQRPGDLREATRPMNALLARILDEGMAEGSIRQADPERLAEVLHGVVAAEVHRNLYLNRRGRRWVDELCEFCLHGVGATCGTAQRPPRERSPQNLSQLGQASGRRPVSSPSPPTPAPTRGRDPASTRYQR